jgi:hypothetical protein
VKAVDYSKLEKIIEQEKSLTDQSFTKIKHLKFTQGTHIVRLLPLGNESDDTFYRYSKTHEFGAGKDYRKVVCWEYMILDHEERMLSQQKPEEERRPVEASLRSYLAKNKKLTKTDYLLAKKHGCPFCEAYKKLRAANADVDVLNRIQLKHNYYFNTYYVRRSNPKEDSAEPGTPKLIDPGLYLWTITSARAKNDILSTITTARYGSKNEDGEDESEPVENPLDPVAGVNLSVRAEGEGKTGRRYSYQVSGKPGIKWFREKQEDGSYTIGVPTEITTYDLIADIEAQTFQPYQECIRIAKRYWMSVLHSIGFEFDGEDVDYEKKLKEEEKADAQSRKDALKEVESKVKDQLDKEDAERELIGTKEKEYEVEDDDIPF